MEKGIELKTDEDSCIQRDRRVKAIAYLKEKEQALREKRLKLEALVQGEVKP